MKHRSGWDSHRILARAVVMGLAIAVISGAGLMSSNDQQPAGRPAQKAAPIGYDDTPFLPSGRWRVHDIQRPHPRLVTPGSESTPDQPGRPPSDATVLFDGKDLSRWAAQGAGKDQGKVIPPAWKVENGYMEVAPGTGDIYTKEKFGDCQLHIEWAAPTEITGSSQQRGNSGVLIMGRYEIQVLDSYQNITYADGQAAAIYGQYPPLVNASRKPGDWQTYDIVFEAPRFDHGKLARPAFVTVFHNGVVVHHRQEILGSVVHRAVATYEPHGPEEPLRLQDHRSRLRYRNLWVRRLGRYDEP